MSLWNWLRKAPRPPFAQRQITSTLSSRRRKDSRPRLEELESRLSPAVTLTLAGGELNLVDDMTGAAPTVTLTEPSGNGILHIALTGATFAHFSTGDGVPSPVLYETALHPDLSSWANISFAANNFRLNVDFPRPGSVVNLGDGIDGITDLSGGLTSIMVTAADTVNVVNNVDLSHGTPPANSSAVLNVTASNQIVAYPTVAITTNDGDVRLTANGSSLTGPTAPYFLGAGVVLNGATIRSTGEGDIYLTGTAPAAGGGVGVLIANFGATPSLVQATGTGNIEIKGTGGTAVAGGNTGVSIVGGGVNTIVTTSLGNVTITGTGGVSPGTGNDGIDILTGAAVLSLGPWGDVTLKGSWYPGAAGGNVGVLIDGAGPTTTVSTGGGNLAITSNTVAKPGAQSLVAPANFGISVGAIGQVVAAGSGTVTLTDLGGQGISVAGNVQTDVGAVTMKATAAPALGAFNGILVTATGIVQSGGGDISLTGLGGNRLILGACCGVMILGAVETTDTGNITLTGTGGTTPLLAVVHGVSLIGASVSAPGGTVTITGVGGGGGLATAGDGVNMAGATSVNGETILVTGTPGLAAVGPFLGINLVSANLNASNRIDLIADSMALTAPSTITAANNVVLRPQSPLLAIGLGGGAAGDLIIPAVLAGAIYTKTLNIGDASQTGNITVGGGAWPAAPGFTKLFLETQGSVVEAVPVGPSLIVRTLVIKAGGSIGLAASPLLVTTDTLAAKAGAGGVFITNTGGVTVAQLPTIDPSVPLITGLSATGGNIVLTTGVGGPFIPSGQINVSANVTNDGAGAIALYATDAAGMGQNINVAAGVAIKAKGGNIYLYAGDNLTVYGGKGIVNPAAITTNSVGQIYLVVNAGPGASDGISGVATIQGSLTALAATITGNAFTADQFNIAPSPLAQIAQITVNAGLAAVPAFGLPAAAVGGSDHLWIYWPPELPNRPLGNQGQTGSQFGPPLLPTYAPLGWNGMLAGAFDIDPPAGVIMGWASPGSGTGSASAPAVTTQPTSRTVTGSAAVTFTTAATGTPAPTIRWQVSSNGGATWTNLSNGGVYSGATTGTLAIANTTGLNGNQYRAVFTNASGSTNSAAATLTVHVVPVVTMQPTSRVVTGPAAVAFTAAATGNPAPTIRWQVSSNGGLTWTNLINGGVYSGVTTGRLAIANAISLNGKQYRALFTNSFGRAISTAATLTVHVVPVVTIQPTSRVVTGPAAVAFTAAATGNPAPTVQWQVSSNGGTTWTNLSNGGVYSGVTTGRLVIANTTGLNGLRYRAVFVNALAPAGVASLAAVLTVRVTTPVTGGIASLLH